MAVLEKESQRRFLIASCFMLGLCVAAPNASLTLSIDFFEAWMPGRSMTLMMMLCYNGLYFVTQNMWYGLGALFPWTPSQRIISCLTAIVALQAAWGLVVAVVPGRAGTDTLQALALLLVALQALADATAIGAVFGSCGALGASTAHALVAGASSSGLALSVLRVLTKLTLPATLAGTQTSIVTFSALISALHLVGLAGYLLGILPALRALGDHNLGSSKVVDKPTEVPLSALTAAHSSSRPLRALPAPNPCESGHDAAAAGGGASARPPAPQVCPRINRHEGASAAPCSDWVSTALHGSMQHRAAGGIASSKGSLGASALASPCIHSSQVESCRAGVATAGCHVVEVLISEVALAAAGAAPRNAAAAGGCTDAGLAGVQALQAPDATAAQASSAVAAQKLRAPTPMPGKPLDRAMAGPLGQPCKGEDWPCHGSSCVAILDSGSGSSSKGASAAGSDAAGSSASGGDAASSAASAGGAAGSSTAASNTAGSSTAGPRWAVPGRSVAACTASLLRDNWRYAAATVLLFAVDGTIIPGALLYSGTLPITHDADGSLGWYLVILVLAHNLSDFAGKLLPLWRPPRPQTALLTACFARALVFIPLFLAASFLSWGPAAFLPLVLALGLSQFVEAPVFALACEGQHPADAYLVEGVLAIMLDVGILIGIGFGFCWGAGPLAALAPEGASVSAA